MEITIHNGGEYRQVLAAVLRNGEPHIARGMKTVDLDTVTVNVLNPYKALPLGLGRNLDPVIAALEALQLIAGESHPDLLIGAAPQFRNYAEQNIYDEWYFHGAYGLRVGEQPYHVVQKLKADPGSRQALITLWDPRLDNESDHHDYPCTTALRFAIRSGVLNMNTVMRSNDAWLGFPYDIFQFTQLQCSMCNALSSVAVDVGTYRHTALSLHVYDRDLDKARAFIDHKNSVTWNSTFQPSGIGRPGDHWARISQRAGDILSGLPLEDPTPSEEWYVDRVAEARIRAAKLGRDVDRGGEDDCPAVEVHP